VLLNFADRDLPAPGSCDEPPRTPLTPALAGKKAALPRLEPSPQALQLLRDLVKRSQRATGVPFAEAFIRRAADTDPAPPLTRLMRGGQGGEVRLKLYLTMSLLAVRAPFDLPAIAARSWPKPSTCPTPIATAPGESPTRSTG